jgi:integrase
MAHIRPNKLDNGKKSYSVIQTTYDADGNRQDLRLGTFRRRKDADDFCRQVGADELQGVITRRPEKRATLFQDFTEGWLKTRLVKGKPLAPSTVIGYQRLLRRNLYPRFANRPVRRISPEDIRKWYFETTAATGHDQAAKSYRLLHAVLNTAAEEGVIPSRVNPCRISGGGNEDARERPLVETSTVLKLAEAVEDRYRAIVYLAGLAGLRTGESLGLRRRDVNPARRQVLVAVQAQEIAGLGRHVSDPKSEAGQRPVRLPKVAMEALMWHMERFTGPEPDAVVFTAVKGNPVRRARLSAAWKKAVAKVGIDVDLRPHDLRHHALTLAARKPGVTTKELMARGGHSSPRAALRYQHAASERDQEIADFIDDQIATAHTPPKEAEVVALHQ